MKVLYIGQYTIGTTSKMRADQLRDFLNSAQFEVIDTHQPFFQTSRLFRSFGFRFKRGPLVTTINQHIISHLTNKHIEDYDLIWVDKGIFVTKKTTEILRHKAIRLVHFTPDMAFYGNKSCQFEKSLALYDFAITTKTKEIPLYHEKIGHDKTIFATQGFDIDLHQPYQAFINKDKAVAFVGLAEKSRYQILQNLVDSGIHLKLAGKGWKKFVHHNRNKVNFKFCGEALFGTEYANFISSNLFGIGLLSKKFPELHTTRTFEIPACGTALITERNSETSSFFTEKEAIFYNTPEEMITKIKYYQNNPEKLELLIDKGRARVIKDGRDYKTIIAGLLRKIGVGY